MNICTPLIDIPVERRYTKVGLYMFPSQKFILKFNVTLPEL